MNELEHLLKKERPRALAFCDMGKPFSYLQEVNKEYFCDSFNLWSDGRFTGIFDFALDDFNYLRRNKVTHAKHESLVRTFVMMYKVIDKYRKEMNVLESEE